jgi:class 3 adenylate cyclase
LLGEKILDRGAPVLAYDVLTAGLKHWPKNVRLRQLLGLALAECGATARAKDVLSQLHAEGNINGETLGILARTYKDLWLQEKHTQKKANALKQAFIYYNEGFVRAIKFKKPRWRDDALYNGINAATTQLLLGHPGKARAMARQVDGICRQKLRRAKNDYWALATRGEAAIILKDLNLAEAFYRRAAKIGQGDIRRLSSSRRQARLLLQYLGRDRHRLDACFGIPQVFLFINEGVQWTDGPTVNITPEMVKKMQTQIAVGLPAVDRSICYSSAAFGPDIIFIEEGIRRDAEINILLPIPKEDFKLQCMSRFSGYNWHNRFEKAVRRASRVQVADERRHHADRVSHRYGMALLTGHALLRARWLDTEVQPIILSPGKGNRIGPGMQTLMKSKPLHVLDPEIIHTPEQITIPVSARGANKSGTDRKIMCILFGDVVNYSRIEEAKIPTFVDYFMGLIAALVDSSEVKPSTRNTWGDALYLVFTTPQSACDFALRLKQKIQRRNWARVGLPEDLNIRMSLHAGPVHYCKDPVINRKKYTGSHVSRTARIEPITPPGEIYASEQFAALAVAQGVTAFSFDYVGQMSLPKRSGIIPLYLVRSAL